MAKRIDEILHDEHGIDPRVLQALTPDDLQRLGTAALDREEQHRVRALDALVTAGAPEAGDILARILRARREDAAIRAAAAAQLGRMPGAETERVLLKVLPTATEPTLRIEIAAALAKIGGPESVDALGKLVEASDGATRRQAGFARSLIAYRHGIAGFELPAPQADEILELDRERAIPFTISRAPLRETVIAFASIAQVTYGVRLSRELAYSIECGPERMLLAFDAELFGQDVTKAARARPLLIGLLAQWAPADGTYSVRWLVLSAPEDRSRVQLSVHRPSGIRVLFGSAQLEGTSARFELRSVRGPGAVAVDIRGRLERTRVRFDEALSAEVRIARESPVPLEPPPVSRRS
jgi:hypothetical protein